MSASSDRTTEIARLSRARPRSHVLRLSVVVLAALVIVAWASGEIAVADLFSARRGANLKRFLSRDALPFPLRQEGATLGDLLDWASDLLATHGLQAALATFWISVLAIALAGLGALVTAPFAARTLMTRDPYLLEDVPRAGAWAYACRGVRVVFVLLRAVPEYVWAFLLLAMLGPNAWPAVLALAIHNGGILGRLGADTIENLDRRPLRALRMLGANRAQLTTSAALPLALPRLLLYLFYRFETCVREATVLGMLGVVSLGYWIQEARGRQRYDEMLAFVALGAVLVLAADLVSHATRSWLRRER